MFSRHIVTKGKPLGLISGVRQSHLLCRRTSSTFSSGLVVTE